MRPYKRLHEAVRRQIAIAIALCALASPAWGASGDVLAVSNVLSGKDLSAISLDTSNNPPGGSFWVLTRGTGQIFHLSLDLNTILGEIPNPHGTGVFPNPILSVGMAYRPLTKTLFVLAKVGPSWKVREVKTTDGLEVSEGAFTISLPDNLPGDLRGFSFDSIAREFWYLDAYNDRLIRTGTDGIATKVCPLPGDIPLETTIRGEGICFDLTEVAPTVFEQRVFVAYGDIFRKNPSKIIQISDACEESGIEVPLGKLSSIQGTPQGIQTFRAGAQRRMAVTMSSGRIAQVEMVFPATIPPSQLHCSLTLTNQVALSWLNHGKLGSEDQYAGEIVVLRNGVAFKTLSGSSTEFIDATPLLGTSTYSLRSSDAPGATLSQESSPCEVTVGPGGIVRWIPFPGAAPYDAARNPETGDIFVTDDTGLNGQGKIFRFDSRLALQGEVLSPWDRPGPIVFVPSVTIDVTTVEDVLAVGRTDGALVKLIDLAGNEKTTLVMEGCTRLASLTFIPSTQEFVCIDDDTATISIADATGRLRRQCRPHEVPLSPLSEVDRGITYDPIQDTFLTVFKDVGLVRELYRQASCLQTRPFFDISLASLGEGHDEPGFVYGVQIAANTLIVCGRKQNALFQVLIFPAGPTFRRGDFDRNDAVNIADAVASVRYLFQSGPAPTCQDAADSNDDGILDVSDPVYLLFHLFLQGLPPPAPFPDAGNDPSFRDNLGCEEA